MLLTCSQMRAAEERAFADGITAEALMEDAGLQIADAIRQFFPSPGRCVAMLGKGHNGGDALVAARHLQTRGWEIELRPAFPEADWSPLTRLQFSRLMEWSTAAMQNHASARRPWIVLDGLLGIGAGGALREPILSACREINRLRQEEDAHVFALDLPTGVNGDTGELAEGAVVADFTLTIGFAKTGLIADSATSHVGRLAVLPLRELSSRASTNDDRLTIATPASLRPVLPRRNFDIHKGRAGRVAIFAGSVGAVGAAIMCAEGAVRGGAGLVTLFVPPEIYAIAATRALPEVMVRPFESVSDLIDGNFQCLALGPGLGLERRAEILELVERTPYPCVMDADALNAVATDMTLMDRCAGPRLLTPHPGEMARLEPHSEWRTRLETVTAITDRWPHAVLLKGARSIVRQSGFPSSYNSTGHPGLATGGVGDILTGLAAALIGQGLSPYDAARVGSWIIGRSAERAIYQGNASAETLSATSLFPEMGAAFTELRSGPNAF